jgi:hypothetical protein
MRRFPFRPRLQRAAGILGVLIVLGSGTISSAQEPPYYPPYNTPEPRYYPPYNAQEPSYNPPYNYPEPQYNVPQSNQYSPSYNGPPSSLPPQGPARFSANELANLVAPIALYPDPLLSQVLAACTYPLELVEAQQWLQQNRNLQGQPLMVAAQQQNWDPSVQALVAFPDVLALLNRNIRWATDLGNAFLAQQADVMDAIQALRAQARGNGQLASTPQFSVNTETQYGQSAIEIQPADPQMMYVPAYDPSYVWGPPAEGSYPSLPYQESGFGSLFQSAISLAGLFTGFPGLFGGSGWGWALNWLGHALFINNSFFSNFGFQNFGGGYGSYGYRGGYGGPAVWAHNPMHRLGIPYANGFLASRSRGEGWRQQGVAPFARGGGGWRRSGSAGMTPGAQSGRAYAPQGQRWMGGGSFQRGNPAAMSGNWRSFSGGAPAPARQYSRPFAQPAWSGNRAFQPNDRMGQDPYAPYSANGRATSSPGPGSMPSRYGAFPNPNNSRNSWPSHSFAQSTGPWGQPSRSSPPRMSSQHASWGRQSFAPQQYSKPQHFSAPHFSAPHFGSHGSSHFSKGHSGGHSGGKSRKR